MLMIRLASLELHFILLRRSVLRLVLRLVLARTEKVAKRQAVD